MLYRIIHCIVYAVYKIFYRMRITGRENIPEGSALICANHTSLKDPVFAVLAMTNKFRVGIMAKAELFRIPVISSLIRWVGAFPVERGAGDVKAIKKSMDILKTGGKLIIFPEGSRIKDDEKSSVRTGAGMLALRTETQAVPVYITQGKKRVFSKVNVVIGKPMSFTYDRKSGNTQYQVVADSIMDEVRRLKPDNENKTIG